MNSADGPRFFVRFTFTNNDRNMHLNEDGTSHGSSCPSHRV